MPAEPSGKSLEQRLKGEDEVSVQGESPGLDCLPYAKVQSAPSGRICLRVLSSCLESLSLLF